MNVLKSAVLAVALVLLAQGVASAQTRESAAGAPAATTSDAARAPAPADLRALGVGLVIIGAGVGIGLIGGKAVESQARQPEMAANIRTTMIIAAALIEGVTLFGLIIIILSLYA